MGSLFRKSDDPILTVALAIPSTHELPATALGTLEVRTQHVP